MQTGRNCVNASWLIDFFVCLFLITFWSTYQSFEQDIFFYPTFGYFYNTADIFVLSVKGCSLSRSRFYRGVPQGTVLGSSMAPVWKIPKDREKPLPLYSCALACRLTHPPALFFFCCCCCCLEGSFTASCFKEQRQHGLIKLLHRRPTPCVTLTILQRATDP